MLFDPREQGRTEDNARLYANLEITYTAVDFAAALLFVAGSALFFTESLRTVGTWCFLVGSVFFALKPTIRLVRELQYRRRGNDEHVADRLDGDLT